MNVHVIIYLIKFCRRTATLYLHLNGNLKKGSCSHFTVTVFLQSSHKNINHSSLVPQSLNSITFPFLTDPSTSKSPLRFNFGAPSL